MDIVNTLTTIKYLLFNMYFNTVSVILKLYYYILQGHSYKYCER